MAVTADFRLLKEKIIDKEITLKISQNIMSGRLFVEFSYKGVPTITCQKSFQDSFSGRIEAEDFSKSIKNLDQLKERFGIKKNNKEK